MGLTAASLLRPRTDTVRSLSIFVALLASSGCASRVAVPKIQGDFIHVYRPTGDVYPGPDAGGLVTGTHYDDWVANDHCFVRDVRGRWHAFGITHPLTDLDHVHAGENQSFHALAPEGTFSQALRRPPGWTEQPKVLTAPQRPGEIAENHAPCIVKKAGVYRMIYGPSPLRYATSTDLFTWRPQGALSRDPGGRDPSVLTHAGVHYLLVCGRHEVKMMTSRDLDTWEEPRIILRMPDGIDPESPTLVHRDGTFYLFVCGWDGVWDKNDLSGAYQHVTYVFQSDDPFAFDGSRALCRLPAHAPEIFQDETGDWYISSAEWPHRGVSVAPLVWE